MMENRESIPRPWGQERPWHESKNATRLCWHKEGTGWPAFRSLLCWERGLLPTKQNVREPALQHALNSRSQGYHPSSQGKRQPGCVCLFLSLSLFFFFAIKHTNIVSSCCEYEKPRPPRYNGLALLLGWEWEGRETGMPVILYQGAAVEKARPS